MVCETNREKYTCTKWTPNSSQTDAFTKQARCNVESIVSGCRSFSRVSTYPSSNKEIKVFAAKRRQSWSSAMPCCWQGAKVERKTSISSAFPREVTNHNPERPDIETMFWDKDVLLAKVACYCACDGTQPDTGAWRRTNFSSSSTVCVDKELVDGR